jgi:hypothetical protein
MGPSNAPLSAFPVDKSAVEILGFRIDVVKVCTLKASDSLYAAKREILRKLRMTASS